MSQNIEIERRLAAVLAADVAGFSRLTEADEVGTMRMLAAQRAILDSAIARHRGRIANTAGDSVLAEFPSAVNAVQCAVEAQQALVDAAEGTAKDRRVLFRIGIHVGDVMVRGSDLLGSGVNVAARLEGLAEPGGIVISAAAHEQVKKILPLVYSDLGLQQVKNIEEPMRAFAIGAAPGTVSLPGDGRSLPLPDKPSIAVLPFQNMSGDPEQEYFADGMVEDIITALSRFKSLFVIARNSSFTYKGKAVDIKQVGRELGVRYVLEGSVRKAGERVRITGQLIDSVSGAHVWADRFDRQLTDVFALQDDVAQSVVSAVEPNLRSAEVARNRTVPTQSLAAYDLYLRALSRMDLFTEDNYQTVEVLVRKTIELDPNYSDAWAMLTAVLGRSITMGWRTEPEAFTEAQEAALTAVQLDPGNGLAHASAAWSLAMLGGSLDEATVFAHRALALHPNSLDVRAGCGWALTYCGEFDDALRAFEAGQRMSPLDMRLQAGMAAVHFYLRHFDETLKLTEVAVRNPTNLVAVRYRAAALVRLARIDDARAIIQRSLEANPRASFSRVGRHFRHPWMRELYLDALRLAGLPE